jgi:CheY-like chemotaxis protein
MQMLLEGQGLDVVLASNGAAGVQLARQLHPDLIILDMQMPEMNGFQACECLKRSRETHHIPVIMLTRHDDPEMVVLGLQQGAIDYIPKDTFADDVLLETLRHMDLIADFPDFPI